MARIFGSAETSIQHDDALWRMFKAKGEIKDKMKERATVILRDIENSFININYSHLNDQLNERDDDDQTNGGDATFIIWNAINLFLLRGYDWDHPFPGINKY